jgi:GT2 family glycosyltransferase
VYLAEAAIYHRGGVSSEQIAATRLFYSLRSRLMFGFKHFGRLEAVLLVVITVAIEPFARVAWALARGSFVEARQTVRGYGELFAYFTQRAPAQTTERT